MNLAIIGSRSFDDYSLLHEWAFRFLPEKPTIVSGGASGADELAENFADNYRLDSIIIEPDYKAYPDRPKYAPIARNYLIVDKSDHILAFWDGSSRGTKSVIDYAHKNNKSIDVIFFKK